MKIQLSARILPCSAGDPGRRKSFLVTTALGCRGRRSQSSHRLRTQNLRVLPFIPGAGLYIAVHATPTARNFFLANFYPSGLFSCIFSKTSLEFFFPPVLALANTGSCVGLKNKTDHLAHCYRQLNQEPVFECSQNINRLQNIVLVFLGFMFRNCDL